MVLYCVPNTLIGENVQIKFILLLLAKIRLAKNNAHGNRKGREFVAFFGQVPSLFWRKTYKPKMLTLVSCRAMPASFTAWQLYIPSSSLLHKHQKRLIEISKSTQCVRLSIVYKCTFLKENYQRVTLSWLKDTLLPNTWLLKYFCLVVDVEV